MSPRATTAAARSGTQAHAARVTRLRWTLFLATCLLLVALLGAGEAWVDPRHEVFRFIAIFIGGGLLGLLALVLLPEAASAGARAAAVMLACLACRAALLPHAASDDVNRYAWEGMLITRGLSPYAHAPADPVLVELRDQRVWPGINHKLQAACYPPFMLLLFAGLHLLHPGLLTIKLCMVACDLAAVYLLLRLLRLRALSERWALLYGLNPVVLYAFAGEGHLDAAHVLLLLLALCLRARGHDRWSFFCLGLAFQAKYVAGLALPFFLSRRDWPRAWTWLPAALAPFLLFLPSDGLGVFASIAHFGAGMAFCGSAHALLRVLLGGIQPATVVTAILFTGICLWALWCRHCAHARPLPLEAYLLLVFGALLALSPTVHFWYLSWVLPLLALRPRTDFLLLSLCMAFYFLAPANQALGHGWSLPVWAYLAIWLPFWALLLWRTGRDLRAWRTATTTAPAAEGVSVVIPALNERENIGACVRAAREQDCVREVLVVDGGSADATVEAARAAGARVIVHTAPAAAGGGRGGQIAVGARAATAEIVAVVHADTLLSPGALGRVKLALAANPDAAGGAVGAFFAGRGAFLRALEIANDLRAALMGISFGDQVQFFRRSRLTEGFPGQPLMEDVELALRLRGRGRVLFLWGACLASSRRWQSGHACGVGRVLRLCAGYLLARLFGHPDTARIYREYYGPPRKDT